MTIIACIYILPYRLTAEIYHLLRPRRRWWWPQLFIFCSGQSLCQFFKRGGASRVKVKVGVGRWRLKLSWTEPTSTRILWYRRASSSSSNSSSSILQGGGNNAWHNNSRRLCLLPQARVKIIEDISFNNLFCWNRIDLLLLSLLELEVDQVGSGSGRLDKLKRGGNNSRSEKKYY